MCITLVQNVSKESFILSKILETKLTSPSFYDCHQEGIAKEKINWNYFDVRKLRKLN